MMDPVDTIEVIQVISALLATLFTMRALHVAYADLKAFPDLRVVAIRRIRQQSLMLLLSLVFLITAVVGLFLSIGSTQTALRSFAFVFAALIVFVLSLTDHLEAVRISTDEHRRNRRASDAPLSPGGEPGDRRADQQD